MSTEFVDVPFYSKLSSFPSRTELREKPCKPGYNRVAAAAAKGLSWLRSSTYVVVLRVSNLLMALDRSRQ